MRNIIKLSVLAILAIAVFLAYNNVSVTITPEDHIYIRKTLDEAGYNWEALERDTFEAQIVTIRAVQDSILKQTPVQQIIPRGETREPRDLFGRGYALCGDRSRFIDKALRKLGFQTRYASLYDSSEISPPLLALLSSDKSKVRSHAMVEVRTDKGWMMVDSVTPWIALDEQGEVYGFKKWKNHPENTSVAWSKDQEGKMYYILKDDFTHIYGLYSRHGKFYPPFTPVPDVNWRALMDNF